MQALPSIEILGFLNWMNQEGYPNLHTDIPIDELFYNEREHQELVYILANNYLRSRDYHDFDAANDIATEILDAFITIFRNKAVEHIQKHPWHFDLHRIRHVLHQAFSESLSSLGKEPHATTYPGSKPLGNVLHRHFHPLEKRQINAWELIQSVNSYLSYQSDPAVFALISTNPSSIAYSAVSFLHYLKNHTKLRNTNIRNVPSDIMESFIDQYIWHMYSRSYSTESRRQYVHSLLASVFIEGKYDDYLGNILPHTEFDDIVKRLYARRVRYKCTLLSDGKSTFDFVAQNWQELNDYSADYLDIFYNEQELLKKGYITADKLNIRSKIPSYPSIYIWEYDLQDGYVIPIDNLENTDILDVFKGIVDLICQGQTLQVIAISAIDLIRHIRHSKVVQDSEEQLLTQSILGACRDLQNQRIWYQHEGKSENAKNTYIASLISRNNFIVKDQTLGGISSTGANIGEIDIKIYRNQDEPFAIIEALNLPARHGRDWHHKYFREHVQRIFGYDTNGLSRNYLLIYAETPMFDVYWKSILHEFTITNMCKFGDSELLDTTDLPEQSNTDLRIGIVRYRRNGRIVKLYVIAVLMSDHADIPHPPAAPPTQ